MAGCFLAIFHVIWLEKNNWDFPWRESSNTLWNSGVFSFFLSNTPNIYSVQSFLDSLPCIHFLSLNRHLHM